MIVRDPTAITLAFQRNYKFFQPFRERASAGKENNTMPQFKIPREPILLREGDTGEYLSTPITKGEGYSVKARYTPEENAKVLEAIKLLMLIADGRYDDNLSSPVTFADRVERNFLAQQSNNKSFTNAVHDSMMECFAKFEELYPEEIPCLHAIFQTAGTGGVLVTIDISSKLLNVAIDGRLNEDNVTTFGIPNNAQFVMPDDSSGHMNPLFVAAFAKATSTSIPFSMFETPANEDPIKVTHERHCSGMKFAKDVLRQSAKAALKLSKIPNVRELYNSATSMESNYLDTKEPTHEKIDKSIEDMLQRAKVKYGIC